MTIDVSIKDGKGVNGTAEVVDRKDTGAGMIVYTEPVRQPITESKVAFNPTFGADMNQNVTFGGTPDGIHNGTDSALWTASTISGTWDFASTTQAQAGTKSIDATATVNNDQALLTRSSTISTGSYTALTGYIYITSWSTSGTAKNVQLQVRVGGVSLGVTLNLSDYIDTLLFNAWQAFTIPIGDFVLGTDDIDELVITTVDIGAGQPPDYYLDTLQWEETGAPAQFTIEPSLGTTYCITETTISMVDALDSTLANASMPNIPYNKFLGLTSLTNGINITLVSDGITRFSATFRNHMDIMQIAGVEFTTGGDATNTWCTYTFTFTFPVLLDSRTKDKVTYTVSDDLSGLLHLRVLTQGFEEQVK